MRIATLITMLALIANHALAQPPSIHADNQPPHASDTQQHQYHQQQYRQQHQRHQQRASQQHTLEQRQAQEHTRAMRLQRECDNPTPARAAGAHEPRQLHTQAQHQHDRQERMQAHRALEANEQRQRGAPRQPRR